jgi:hypothetical protein
MFYQYVCIHLQIYTLLEDKQTNTDMKQLISGHLFIHILQLLYFIYLSIFYLNGYFSLDENICSVSAYLTFCDASTYNTI